MADHRIVKCRHCFKVIGQCRCPAPSKRIEWSVCALPACQDAEKAAQAIKEKSDG